MPKNRRGILILLLAILAYIILSGQKTQAQQPQHRTITKTGTITLTDTLTTESGTIQELTEQVILDIAHVITGAGETTINEQLTIDGAHNIVGETSISKTGSITLTDTLITLGPAILNEQLTINGTHRIKESTLPR